MIQAINVTLRLGKRALFEDVNIKFTEGNCYGLIGANGAGKSTFLKILSGELEPSQGEVAITDGQRLSVLKQDHYQYDEYTVLDAVMLGNTQRTGSRVCRYERLGSRIRCRNFAEWTWY